MDVNSYLSRIGIHESNLEPNLDNLIRLQLAHVSKVPFENLDMFGGERRQLDLLCAYNKIIKGNRGGICYEVNALYTWLLRQLKYNVKVIQGQPYVADTDQFCHHMSHFLPMVQFGNGTAFITDVAFGKHCCLNPVLLKENTEQVQPNGVYRLRRVDLMSKENFYLEEKYLDQVDENGKVSPASVAEPRYSGTKYREEGWNILYKFTVDTKYELNDFGQSFDYYHDDPDSFFRNNSFVSVNNNGSVWNLWGNTLTEISFRKMPHLVKFSRRTVFTDEEIRDIIMTRFGFTPPQTFRPKAKSLQL